MDKENVIYIYTHTHTLNHKKNEILPFSTMWMDPEGEISQMEKDKYHMISLICGTTKTLKHKTKTKSQVQRTDWWLARGKWVGGGGEVGNGGAVGERGQLYDERR